MALVPSQIQLHHVAGPDWLSAVKIQMLVIHLQVMAESEIYNKMQDIQVTEVLTKFPTDFNGTEVPKYFCL